MISKIKFNVLILFTSRKCAKHKKKVKNWLFLEGKTKVLSFLNVPKINVSRIKFSYI